jgi:hypothetical protein
MSSSLWSDVPTRISSAKEASKLNRGYQPGPDMSVATMLQPASRGSASTSSSFEPMSRTNTYSSHDGARSIRQSKRVSMTALYVSINAKDKDLEISDDLARAQRTLRDLKSKISTQSKKNFVLEKDVRYLLKSRMKSPAILKMPNFKKDPFPMTKKLRSMAISSSCFNPSPDTSLIYVDWCLWQKSTLSSRLSCSPFTGISTKVERNIYC